ncbi:unnamed protein product [Calypogeia fissa]
MSKRVCITAYFAVVFISASLVFVEGRPIRGPDFDSCQPFYPLPRAGGDPSETAGADLLECCVFDTSRPIKEFKFNLDLPMRVRRPAHKLDDEFIRKYERAVELMRALPPEDPRSFSAQAKLHCAYSGSAYKQFNTSVKLSVHSSWLLFPFHRWYTYFHERILASLIGDDTFAIPYWAWDVQNEDNPPANTIPPIFTDKNSSLYDEKRSKVHQPPHRVDLSYGIGVPDDKNPDILLQGNYYSMWAAMIGHTQTTEAFYGGRLSEGDASGHLSQGVFEVGPHASIHSWTGDKDIGQGEDMWPSYSAARDPIFFAHHTNVDRLWLMWKSFGGLDYDDPDWLEAEFVFYDENADLVRVNIQDSLNLDNFRITYEEVEADWLSHTPQSIRDIDRKYAKSSSILRRFWHQAVTWSKQDSIAMALGSFLQTDTSDLRISLRGHKRAPVTSRVSRPDVVKSMEDSSLSDKSYDEVLVITGVVDKPFDATVLLNMFLELPEADENTPQHCVEFLGGVGVDAEGLAVGTDPIITREFVKIVGIRHTLRILGITRQKSVTVTFVPAWDPKYDTDVSVRVSDLKVERRRVR